MQAHRFFLVWSRSGEDAVKMAAHGVFLLINHEGGVKAWGWGTKKKQMKKKKKTWRKAVQFTLIAAYVFEHRLPFVHTLMLN